jgi:hypothetical protein
MKIHVKHYLKAKMFRNSISKNVSGSQKIADRAGFGPQAASCRPLIHTIILTLILKVRHIVEKFLIQFIYFFIEK